MSESERLRLGKEERPRAMPFRGMTRGPDLNCAGNLGSLSLGNALRYGAFSDFVNNNDFNASISYTRACFDL